MISGRGTVRNGFYNRRIVVRSGLRFFSRSAVLAAVCSTACCRASWAQGAEAPPQASAQKTAGPADIRQQTGRLVLVLPFDNRSGASNLNWIGESFPYTLNERLSSAGFLTISRDDRMYALEHLGLPEEFRPSRASTIKIAQMLDANFVILGSYTVVQPGTPQSRIDVQAQVLEIDQLHMSNPVSESNALPKLYDVENALAWQMARTMDPHFAVARRTFVGASGSAVKLSSFENYIRGIDASNPDERLKRLENAVAETPNYSAALLALGKEQYTQRQYEAAATTLAKVSPGDRLGSEAGFYRGLARFNAAKYADAQSAFALVASRLPLPEVVNDQGVATSRQGKDAVPLFQQAVAADPNDADYHFNLGVGLMGRSDIAGAIREVQAALKLHGDDAEASDLLNRLQSLHGSTTNLKTVISAGGFDPTPRIRRTWSEASFRQAAFQLEQMRALQVESLPPGQQAVQYTQFGSQYLAQGFMPEAEQDFQTALKADAKNAAAHAGLAEVRERTGDTEEARTEAEASLKLMPSVNAYLVLARIELEAGNLPGAAANVGNALRMEPKNAAALAVKATLVSRGQAVP